MKPLAIVRSKGRVFELHHDHAVMKTARRTVVVRVGETYRAKYAGTGRRKDRVLKVVGFEFERGSANVVHDGEGKKKITMKNFADLYVLLKAAVIGTYVEKSPFQKALEAPAPTESMVRVVPSLPNALPHRAKDIPRTTVEQWCMDTCEIGEQLQKMADELGALARDLEHKAWKAWEAAAGDLGKKNVKPAIDLAHAIKKGPLLDKLRVAFKALPIHAEALLGQQEKRVG